ncbi:IGR protein motif-domain-containing protein [Trichophaea hybrida]|nr:IGR protein motif-domain-containing protein [Trichophaea hybrida]
MFFLRRLLLLRPALSRGLHHSLPLPPPPETTAKVPDVSTFLTLIGRNCKSHSAKIESWDHLFSATSSQLRTLGIEPARTRKYIIRWREKFRLYGADTVLKEQKRGRKIDGGERRRKEFRAKRFAEERKAAAEAK